MTSCTPHAMVSTRLSRPHRPDVTPLTLVPAHAQPTKKACSHPTHSARHALAQPHHRGPLLPSPLHITYTEVRRGKLQFVPDPALSKNALPPPPIARSEEREAQLYATAHGDTRGKIRRGLNRLAGM